MSTENTASCFSETFLVFFGYTGEMLYTSFVKIIVAKNRLLLFFLLWIVQTTFAQPPDFHFNRLTAYSSLSSQFASKMVQDSIGFLWIATDNGVNRFDGHEIVVYKSYDGLASTGLVSGKINELFLDSQDRLWVGTPVGISCYDKEYDRFRVIASSNVTNGLKVVDIRCILEDSFGRIIVVSGSEIYVYSEADERFELLFNSGNLLISSILFDKNNGFWLGYFDGYGIDYFSSFDLITPDNHFDGVSKATSVLKMIMFEGDVWCALGDDGVVVVDTVSKRIKKHYTYDTQKLYVINVTTDRSGNLWLIDHSGLKLFHPDKDSFTAYYNSPEIPSSLRLGVVDLFEDRQGNYYTLHKGDGVYVSFFKIGFQLFNTSDRYFWHTTTSNISAISADDKGNLWLGGFNGGIDVFNWDKGRMDYYYGEDCGLGIGTVTFIFRDSKQNIWTSSYMNGLKRFNPATKTFETWKNARSSNSIAYNDVRGMAEDSLGNFWLATHGGGVDYFEIESNRFTNFNSSKHKLSTDWVNDVMIDDKNRLWVGTKYGVSMKTDEDSVFRAFIPDVSKTEGLKGNDATCLLQSRAGTIWVGTNQGLYSYVEADNTFSICKSFPMSFITSLELDQHDELWIGTYEGLWKLNPATGRIHHFDEHDGLQGIDFNARASYFNGIDNLVFGGTEGVNLFYPEKLEFNNTPPNLRFSRFLLFNIPIEEYGEGRLLEKELNSIDEIVLEYDQNFFTIEYVAFNYDNPLKNQYACKLEGFDKNWVDRGNKRSTSYTNLFPGKYIFRVKASNNHGVWNEEGIALVIRVLPPWWLTVWFFLAVVGLIIFSWFLAYRYRTRSLRKQGVRLVQLVSEQTGQLRESNEKLKQRTVELKQFNQILEERQSTITDQAKMLKSQAENLQVSNEELLRMIATRDKMFSIIAHDLRSPFNTILGFTGLLREDFDESDPRRMKEYARYIHDASTSVFNLLENLLFWARSQTNQIQFHPSVSELDEIVADSLLLVRESAVKKNQIIDTSQYRNCEVFVDLDMMRSVVRNLIMNAIKFTFPEGSIKIASRMSGKYVKVSISDTGKGMSQDDIKRVYKNLSINSSPGTSGEKGSGLGLSLSYEFIKKNGGELTIESVLGKGSTFAFTLPTKPSA